MSVAMRFREVYNRIKENSLFKDSFWAVAGNGLGNFLLLVSGIIIARLLGKDVYGEYGMVKTTMLYLALFSTLSLGNTTTRFVAEYIVNNPRSIYSIIRDSFTITIITSFILSGLLVLFAKQLSVFIKAPQLAVSFKYLGIIVIFRALGTVGAGIIAGFKNFKDLGLINVFSGLLMLILCIPLTKYFGLTGALVSLLLSQVCFAILTIHCVRTLIKCHGYKDNNENSIKLLLNFTYPFAIAEFVFTAASFGTNLIVTRYSSLGEFGIYTACSQWNSIILFVPGLLGSVILSHLSTAAAVDRNHSVLMRRMIMVNLICTVIPLVVVYLLSPWIVGFYGPSYAGMGKVLVIMISSTVFICIARVFQSELTSVGKKWTLMIIRCSYNLLILVVSYIVLKNTNGNNAALNMAYISVSINAISLLLYYSEYRLRSHS